MTDRPDVVKRIVESLKNTYSGAEVKVTPAGIAMVTTDQDRFTIQIQRTSHLQQVIERSRQ